MKPADQPFAERSWLRFAITVACLVVPILGLQKAPTPKGQTKPPGSLPSVPIVSYPGRIVIAIRGVVAIMDERTAKPSKVFAVMPKNRAARHSRFDPQVLIPEHHSFVRWPVGQLIESKNVTVEKLTTKLKAGKGKAITRLRDDQSLSVEGVDPTDLFKYDRREISDPNEDNSTAFYWVTGFDRLCAKRDYIEPNQAALLTEIRLGTLASLPPEQTWSFANRKDVPGVDYITAVAPGALWVIKPLGDSFTVKLSGGGELKFKVTGTPIEIGNYPSEDIEATVEHYPKKGEADPHFELYDDFYITNHSKDTFHRATFVSEIVRSTGGPSCGPGDVPWP